MFPDETKARQEKLLKLIYELSKRLLSSDEKQIKQCLNRLNGIYADDFKHKYSDFFPVLMEIYKEDNEYNIDYLSNNLDMLGTYLEKDYFEGENEYSGIYMQFTKLCDHLNLQIGQFSIILSREMPEALLQELGQHLKESNEKIKESLEKMEDSNKKLEESNKKASTIQTDLIAILSIFAAIVITFSGGLTLLGSNIASVSNAKHYESVVLIAIICGMVMFNTIFLMMYYVSKLTEKNIFVQCKAETCTQCTEPKCSITGKIRKKLPYVFYYNVLSVVGIVVDLVVWFLDIKGYII